MLRNAAKHRLLCSKHVLDTWAVEELLPKQELGKNAADAPQIHLFAPGQAQHNLRRTIAARLHVGEVYIVSKHSRSNLRRAKAHVPSRKHKAGRSNQAATEVSKQTKGWHKARISHLPIRTSMILNLRREADAMQTFSGFRSQWTMLCARGGSMRGDEKA